MPRHWVSLQSPKCGGFKNHITTMELDSMSLNYTNVTNLSTMNFTNGSREETRRKSKKIAKKYEQVKNETDTNLSISGN
jgi:hypothetical protein